jgi:hypothetical protein
MGVVSATARQPDLDSPMVYVQTDAAMSRLEPQSPVALQIERGGKLMFVTFTLE